MSFGDHLNGPHAAGLIMALLVIFTLAWKSGGPINTVDPDDDDDSDNDDIDTGGVVPRHHQQV